MVVRSVTPAVMALEDAQRVSSVLVGKTEARSALVSAGADVPEVGHVSRFAAAMGRFFPYACPPLAGGMNPDAATVRSARTAHNVPADSVSVTVPALSVRRPALTTRTVHQDLSATRYRVGVVPAFPVSHR